MTPARRALMRQLRSLWICLLLCGGCSGESDDGGRGSGGSNSGGTAGVAGGSGGATSTGGHSSGATGGTSSGGGGAPPSCSCPQGTACTVWCKGDGKIFKQECVPAQAADAGCSALCGNDYPWSCGFATCEDAPMGATICMGA